MELFWKTTAGILIAGVLALQLDRQSADTGVLLKTACCAMAAVIAFTYLRPVMEFSKLLEQTGNLKSDILIILLKSLGIGITADIAAAVCADAGCASLGKAMNLLGTGSILYLSLPIFRTLIEVVQQLMGEI